MIDKGRGDQENFEKKNCGQSPQKIRNKSAKIRIHRMKMYIFKII